MKIKFGDDFKRKHIGKGLERDVRSRLKFPGAEKIKITFNKKFNARLDGPAEVLAKAKKALTTLKRKRR